MKTLKKWTALLLAVMMMLTFAACDDQPETPNTPDTPAAVELPSAEFTEYVVKIQGAEMAIGTENESVLRVYYDFTNNSEETIAAESALGYDFVQDGSVLDEYASTVDDDEIAEMDNGWLDVRPGASIRCVVEQPINKDGGPVSVTLYDYTYDEDELKFDLDPSALPGKPAEAFVIAPVADPKFTEGLPVSGVYEEDYEVSIDGAERVKGDEGDVVRITYTFKNNSDEEENMWFATEIAVFQDGVEVDEADPEEEIDTDELYHEDVAPGASVTASVCYELRSDSPIEVEFIDGWDATIGARFDVK